MNVGFLYLNNVCNMKCRHCYVSSSVGAFKGMEKPVLEEAILLFAALGIRQVRLAGGEPTLHPSFAAITQRLKQEGWSLGIVTNGLRLYASHALQRRVATDFDRVWVSLYGVTPQGHDHIRDATGKPFYEAVACFRRLQDYYEAANRFGQIGLSLSLAPGECGSLRSALTALANWGIKRIRIVPVQLDGRAREHFSFDGPAFLRRYNAAITEIPQELVKRFSELRFNDPADLHEAFHNNNASCLLRTKRMTTVMDDGNVYPCCFLAGKTEFCVGRLGETSIDTIVARCAGIPENCVGLSGQIWNDPGSSYKCPISYVQLK